MEKNEKIQMNSSEVLNAAEVAAMELAKLQAELKVAKAKLAEAKLAAKKTNGRPIRLFNWQVFKEDSDVAQPIYKSDVHYCAEKYAIDAIKNGNLTEAYVKYVTKDEENKSMKLVQHLYLNEDGILTIA